MIRIWGSVRTVGELQVLTRASYLALVVVPVLAGVWPAVRVALNRYNQVVSDSRAALEAAAERLEFIATLEQNEVLAKKTTDVLSSLDTQLLAIVNNYGLPPVESVGLPSVWAWAFLASLAVFLGHLVYQAFAPTLVQDFKFADYVDREVRAFVETPSNARVNQAINTLRFLREVKGYSEFPTFNHKDLDDVADAEERKRLEIDIVRAGAMAEYDFHEGKGRVVFGTISAVLYSIGLLLLGYIIYTQTLRVIQAAWG